MPGFFVELRQKNGRWGWALFIPSEMIDVHHSPPFEETHWWGYVTRKFETGTELRYW